MQRETFGPHAPILRVKDIDEAIAVANGTTYGLSAGVCTNDLGRVPQARAGAHYGTVNVREVPGYRSSCRRSGDQG